MASSTELLESIQTGMRLYKGFFLKIYGYEYTQPGFAETAIEKLTDARCSNARNYYNSIVAEYENKRDEEMRKVAVWYREQLEKETENKKRNEVSALRKNLQGMSDRNLLQYAKSLTGVGL